MKTQRRHTPHYSFEFFPPKTEEIATQLKTVSDKLSALKPHYFSVTFGAGGSTRDQTLETAIAIREGTGIDVAPHLSCVGSTREQMRAILDDYRRNGVRRIVALRGDIPSGTSGLGEFRYASELVEFIRAETGDHFRIEVAAYPEFHPQAPSAALALEHFKRKVDAGANGAITQYFYSAPAYFRFIDDCERLGLDTPIVPGIMPITNYSQLLRFSEACGAEIPRWMRKRLEGYADDRKAIRDFGADVLAELCRQLLDQGAPGLHVYSMNLAKPSLTLFERLGLCQNSDRSSKPPEGGMQP